MERLTRGPHPGTFMSSGSCFPTLLGTGIFNGTLSGTKILGYATPVAVIAFERFLAGKSETRETANSSFNH